jgi:hypothetical protein
MVEQREAKLGERDLFTSTSAAYVHVREGYELIARAGTELNTAFCQS